MTSFPLCLDKKKIATIQEMIQDDIQNRVIDFENRNLLGAVLYQIRQWQIHSFQLNQDSTNLMENFFNLKVLTDDQKRELSRQIEPRSLSPLSSPSRHPRLDNYIKRNSLRIKQKIAKLPLLSIDESLAVAHTSPPVSPSTSLSGSGSDIEYQSLVKNRKNPNLKRLHTNSPASPKVTFAEGIKMDSLLSSPNSPRCKERNFTHRGRIEPSRSEVPATLESIVSPRRSWNDPGDP